MISRQSIGWFLLGFAVATALAAGGIVPARAQQTTFEPLTAGSDKLLTRPRSSSDSPDDARVSANLRSMWRSTLMPEAISAAPEGSIAPRQRPAAQDAGGKNTAFIGDGLSRTRMPSGQEQDGRFANPDFSVKAGDGPLSAPDPGEAKDGGDPRKNDTRTGRDADAFLTPQEISDRTLSRLQVEPLDGRLVDRLFRFEPYERVGYSVGSFILFPEIEFGTLWHSNVTRSADPRSDIAATMLPNIEMLSNLNTHALAARANGNLSAYRNLSDENDRAYQIDVRGRLDVTRRTNFEALVGRSLAQEQRSSIDASRTGERSDITTDRAVLAFNTRFNRLSLQIRGALEEVAFEPTIDQLGHINLNLDRNSTRHGLAARMQWEFKPSLYGFVEAGGDQRDFEQASANDGLLRDSRGNYAKVGTGFGTSGDMLRGEVGIGYRRQDFDEAQLADVSGVIFDADVAWRLSALTTLRFRSQADVVETTTAGSGGGLARIAEVAVRHAFRRHIIGTAGLGYTWQSYAGQPLSDAATVMTAGLDYYASRELVLFSRYQHTAFRSDDAVRNYDDDSLMLGVRVRR